MQSDAFNRSRLRTVIAVALTTNMRLLDAPGNVLVAGTDVGLPRDSVANVTQVVTLDRDFLVERAGQAPSRLLTRIAAGLRLALDL